jgi:ABC-type glycerol-3-phosphate transport system substrate-binding protein
MSRPRDRLADVLPIGFAPTVMLTIAVATGVYLLAVGREVKQPDMTVWTFSNTHFDAFKQAVPDFEQSHGPLEIALQLVHYRVLDRRLRSAMWAGLDVPDLVEVNFNRAGTFFRGPVDRVGFIDLTPFLERTDTTGKSYLDRVLPSRLAAYTNRGRVFGIPHDVHPYALAYRRDIFEANGIDPDSLRTWDDFIEVAGRLTIPDSRYMIQLDDTGVLSFEALLLQRGGGFFDAGGELTIDSETAVQALLWFVPLVAGPERIADNPASQGQAFYKAIGDGYVLSFLCPDWLTSKIEMNLPRLSGKLALMPLPAVTRGGRRTTVRSGTMLGITTATTDPELAWELATCLYFDRSRVGERFRTTNTLPPNRDAWDDPAFHEPRAYWSGQRIGELFIDLAGQVPTQYSSPYQELAATKVGQVIAGACAYYRLYGDDGFESFVRGKLHEQARAVRIQMQRNPFQDTSR